MLSLVLVLIVRAMLLAERLPHLRCELLQPLLLLLLLLMLVLLLLLLLALAQRQQLLHLAAALQALHWGQQVLHWGLRAGEKGQGQALPAAKQGQPEGHGPVCQVLSQRQKGCCQ